MDQNGQLHKGKPIFQSNQSLNSSQSQSNLLASLRNEGENSNMAEIIVRPTPINTKKYDEGITKAKHLNPNISLTPLIKNFRLNSFDFHGEFNVEKHMKNTQILKPLTDFKLKSNNKLSNKNYELAMLGCQTPKPTSKQSINYLAAGEFIFFSNEELRHVTDKTTTFIFKELLIPNKLTTLMEVLFRLLTASLIWTISSTMTCKSYSKRMPN